MNGLMENAMPSELEVIFSELAQEIRLEEIELKQRSEALEKKRSAFELLQSRVQRAVFTVQKERVRLNDDMPPARKMGVSEAIVEIVKSMPQQDIFVGNVYDALLAMNVDLPDNERDARIRVGTQLNRLEDRGLLEKTTQGGGNVPNRYRLKKENSDLA